MCVEESVHIIFDETNFMTSKQDTNDFKIGLANFEDDERCIERARSKNRRSNS